jgi:hypothetical protein
MIRKASIDKCAVFNYICTVSPTDRRDQWNRYLYVIIRTKNECIDFNMGCDIWIDRFGIFRLWQKAKSRHSASLRHSVDGISIFYFKSIHYDPFRYYFGCAAVFYQNIAHLFKSHIIGHKAEPHEGVGEIASHARGWA